MPVFYHYLPYIILLGLLWAGYFWLIGRPRRVALKEHKELIDSLRRGDRIVTAGGIHGRIVGLQEDTLTLEVAPGVEITLERRAVRRRKD